MKPLIDGDILLYEIGFGSETGWRGLHPESTDPPPFDYVREMVDGRIEEICNKVLQHFGKCDKPHLFLTGKGNFREEIAKKKKYKGNRTKPKPFHYNNIKTYLMFKYDCTVAEGCEADDLLCIKQVQDAENTIICSRDKDLRQCPGWHFGWELGKQPQYGPKFVEELGELYLSDNKKEVKGTGWKFFFAQLLIGDKVDNIPGLPQNGPVKAYETLSELQTYEEMEKAVSEAYRAFYGDSWKEEIMEQAALVYMVRERDEEGNLVMWRLSEG